jgi:cold shock CspA family protein
MTKQSEMTISGTVKWFDVSRGYGFIVTDEPRGRDLFFHVTQLVDPDWSQRKPSA